MVNAELAVIISSFRHLLHISRIPIMNTPISIPCWYKVKHNLVNINFKTIAHFQDYKQLSHHHVFMRSILPKFRITVNNIQPSSRLGTVVYTHLIANHHGQRSGLSKWAWQLSNRIFSFIWRLCCRLGYKNYYSFPKLWELRLCLFHYL